MSRKWAGTPIRLTGSSIWLFASSISRLFGRQKSYLRAKGLDVLGPIDHGFCESIYFHDPNGHRLEFAANKLTFNMIEKLSDAAQPMLDEWNKSKKTVHHSAWLHEKELARDKPE